jgi:UDP-N-acetylmuramate--alanine ligase
MNSKANSKNSIFENLKFPMHFVGVAGVGMSAIAQYLGFKGCVVTGSDRRFGQEEQTQDEVLLAKANIECFAQDASVFESKNPPQTLVLSTAIEESNVELIRAKENGISILHRSEILAELVKASNTIAVAGTSGKSTTVGMIFHILKACGFEPSVMTGAGLCDLEKAGYIGNAWAGESDLLVIEADESDGSLVNYAPQVGVVLNIDRDHKELDELAVLFEKFKANTQKDFIAGWDNLESRKLLDEQSISFGDLESCDYVSQNVKEQGVVQTFEILTSGSQKKWTVNNVILPVAGDYNRSNAIAALAACESVGLDLESAIKALASYPGIHRRFQLLINEPRVLMIDDYAHNPAKIEAVVKAAQKLSQNVNVWFQPHGFAPTRFMREELVEKLGLCLRKTDRFDLGEIYYAGGTANKSISSSDLIDDLNELGCNAAVVKKEELLKSWVELSEELQEKSCYLLLGARDPGLAEFSLGVAQGLKNKKG